MSRLVFREHLAQEPFTTERISRTLLSIIRQCTAQAAYNFNADYPFLWKEF